MTRLRRLALIATLMVAHGPSVTAAAADTQRNWAGFHLGFNTGYGWKRADISETPGDPNSQLVNGTGQPNVPALATSIRSKGWLGGIQAGYNWQFSPRWVGGIEADFDWANLKGDASVPTTLFFGNETAAYATHQSIDWFGTVRARLGYLATPNLLLYATGGLAYGKVRESATIDLPPGRSNSVGNSGYAFACGGVYGSSTCFAGSDSRVSVGWVIGAGSEQRIAENLNVKMEYLHIDLGHHDYRMNGSLYAGASFAPSFLNATSKATIDLIRLGLVYRFGN